MHVTKVDGALILQTLRGSVNPGRKRTLKAQKKHQNDDRKAKRFKNKEIGLARQKNCR
ncbi:hypothetical protein [Vibrio cholerae]|uniref:hypothetical protein n=1 Tax=Vibrio cholerae TaxID=666 RepID=UPI0013EF406B|nr:hypothetical protein [Vibrio cholerae]